MEADAGGPKKRKAVATAAQRKKPRRSTRHKSEFVSVEVGMREFKKRLASGAAASTASTASAAPIGEPGAGEQGLKQDVEVAKARAQPTKTAATRTPAKKVTPVKKAAAEKTATPVKKAAAAAKKTAAVKKAPVKRATRATKTTVAAKMTLAQVKLQLEREQQQRVEQRIQTLHREAKPTAVAAATTTTMAPVIATSAPVVPAVVAPAVVAPVDAPPHPQISVAVSLVQQQNLGGNPVTEAATPSLVLPIAAQGYVPGSQPTALPIAPIPAAPVSFTQPPPSPKNEFIADDMDEDLMFAMALEEVERKLATPQKPPPPVQLVAGTTHTNSLASVSLQAPIASPIPAKIAPVEPQAQMQSPTEPRSSESVAGTKQAAPVALAPEVLEEMERLRRENELLRRSNELLQAAATSPTQAEARADEKCSRSPGHSLEHSNGPGGKIFAVASSKNASPGEPTARYLDLAKYDSDQDMKHTATVLKDDQPQKRDRHPTEIQSVHSEPHGGKSLKDISAHGFVDKKSCGDQRKQENEMEPIVDQEAATELASELPNAVTSQEQAPSASPPGHSSLSGKGDHFSTKTSATENEPDHVGETPSSESVHSTKLSFPMENATDHSLHATNESDDGDVSDVSMSEVDEDDDDDNDDGQDEEETIQKEDNPIPRTSTIDSGNYTEYKVRRDDAHECAEDEYRDDTSDAKVVLSDEKAGPVQALATSAKANSPQQMAISESDANQQPGTPANSDILERTTAPSNTDDEEEEADEEEAVIVQRVKRREVIALSSSSSESESESESEEDESNDTSSANVLEAALKAAGGDSGRKSRLKPSCGVNSAVIVGPQRSKNLHSVSASTPSPSVPVKATSKKRRAPGLSSTSARKPSSVKSSLLWPALDEFYDFLLDLVPKNVRGSEQTRVHLQRFAGGKLPAQHASIEDYCNVQLESIMEELVSSVSNTTDRRGGGSSPTRQLSLSSVSPCGMQGLSSSSMGLSFGAIFSESGFTGNTSNSNDYILTFDASALGKKSSSDFMSGDLVLVRSPRWKNYEICAFGVVLCDSVVAVGGKSGPGGKGGGGGSGDSDQICVLIRAQKRDRDDAVGNFSVLTELCLSNQRAPNWRWTLQQVHNTTTSAREFQAIKAISFFPNDLKQVLLRGQIVPSSKSEQDSKKSASSSILSPRLLKYLQKHYNQSQMQAILGCLGEDSRVIIQGPPGTGKTKTILGLLSALLDGAGLSTLQKAKGTARIRVGASLQSARTLAVSKTVAETSIRVLVAAPSNAAVDELVVRVLSEGLFDGEKGLSYRPRIVRVGRPESSQQLSSFAAAREASESKKNRKKMRKYAREVEEVLLESLVTKHRSAFPTVKQARQAIIKNAQIVFCTLSGAGSVAMCEFAQDFDALIIDEAAQAVEASTLIPFKFRPHRVVLVGDHRQLPATVISKKLVSMGYDRSLQQRLVDNDSPVLLLTQQYRMHPEIAEFPSTYFYGGRLVQDDNMREWTAQDYHRDRAFNPLLFLDVQGAQSQVSGSTSLRNMSEVEAVVQLVRRLLQKFPHIEWKKRIGVIAPYKQQIYEVRGAISRLEAEFDRHLGIEVNTVDGFQGREKEIIIYSCVRTSHGGHRKKKKRGNGSNEEDDVLDAFWADERRMNVAITRAKSSLWIVGNSTLLKQSRAWRALIQHTKDHKRYIGESTALFAANSSTQKTSKASK